MGNIYIGSKFNQTCDSKGPHNAATLTDLGDGTTHVVWQATQRQNTSDYEHTWGGPFSWDNLYCWVSLLLSLPASSTPLKLLVDVNFGDMSNVNGFEHQAQYHPPYKVWNMALQFLPKLVSTFDFATKHWVPAFPLTAPAINAGHWTRFCDLFVVEPDGPQHNGVQYNAAYTPLSIHRPWVADNDGRQYLDFAFQIDSLNKGTVIDAVVGTRLVVG